ncbi:MAG: hypothetical protein AMS19_02585 [Gemmatimonas sp. SG8_23]|jgi:hypothetical protein|nr:MAG: hypothetical protein AMS19_02585 [Gemmatimonas sp. SG8_23]
MAERDRVLEVAEAVGSLADTVGKIAEMSAKREAEFDDRLKAIERALDGQVRIGNKLGALASAMEKNLEVVNDARARMNERAEQMRAELRETLVGRIPERLPGEPLPPADER